MEKKHSRKAISSAPVVKPEKPIDNLQDLGNLSSKPEEILHLCLSSVAMAKIPILWFDPSGKFFLVNEEACLFAGYSRDEFLSLSLPDLMPEYGSLNLRDWMEEIAGRGALTLESVIRTKAGIRIPVEITANHLNLNGKAFFFTLVRDITDRHRAESALIDSEKQYRAIFETNGAATMLLEEDATISLVNKEFERIAGEKKEAIIGRKGTDFFGHPDLAGMSRDHEFRRQAPGSAPTRFETHFVEKNGRKREILVSAGLIPGTSRSLVSFIDITEHKQTEEAARKIAKEKEILAEISRIISSTLEIEEVYEKFAAEVRRLIPFDRLSIHLNKPLTQMIQVAYFTGTPVEERNKGSLFPWAGSFNEAVLQAREALILQGTAEEIASSYPSLKRNLEAGLRSFLSVPLISQGGIIGYLHFCSSQPFAYKGPDRQVAVSIGAQIAGAIANAELFAQRRKIQDALRKSEEKYRVLVQNANDAIFIAQEGKVKFPTFHTPNPKFLEVTGYSAEELAKAPPTTSFLKFIYPDDQKMVMERHFKRMKGEDVPSVYSFRLLNKKGETVWVQINSVPTQWEGKPATLCFLRDISNEKKLEAQIYTAQKMEAVGTLASGIAHDFNNILMGVQGYVSLLLLGANGNPSNGQLENLKRIEELVKSGSALTGQLLAFARKGKYEVKPSDLNRIIERAVDVFGRTKKEVNHHKRFAGDLWPAEVDRGQIEQVFLNLFVNAWQAMPRGGDLYLETQNVTLDQDYIKPFFVKPGNYVKVSVTDTGVGMDKQTQQRIFEPFFTTKELGRGTGLGLAMVYGIIKSHGGHINVYSEKGRGTTFSFYLPASPKEVQEEKKTPVRVLQGKETILLVDDEETITDVVAKALRLTGYNSLVARSGGEAVEKYQAHREQIDLVLLDMIMPGMGGGAAYDRLKEINPAVKVILSSGYSLDGEASQILEKGCHGFIQKPFGIQELSQKIREVLDT